MSYYVAVLKKYAVFSGRARRKEYWMFVLLNAIIGIIVMLLDNAIGIGFSGTNYGPISMIYSLALFLPSLAVTIRRLHDLDKSGFWVLIELIPVVGAIWLFVMLCFRGTDGENRFGPDPIGFGE